MTNTQLRELSPDEILANCNHCSCWPDSVAGSGCRCVQPCRECRAKAQLAAIQVRERE